MAGELRIIVNADDFGRTEAINHAVVRAHREGILTSASLMVNEPCTQAAVQLARENPRLAIGLHLTLIQGHSALPCSEIPGLVDAERNFGSDPVALGMKYFFNRALRAQLERELAAQFRRFAETGLPLDHVNGHMHLHMQPVVFSILMANAEKWGIRRFRLLNEPLRPNLRAASGRLFWRALDSFIFSCLSFYQGRALRRRGIRHPGTVFGQLQTAHVDEAYLLRLLPGLGPGVYELYSHPSLDDARPEFEALVSPRVRRLAESLGVQWARYQDL